MKDFEEYKSEIEKLARKTLDELFELSGQQMGDEAPDLIKKWQEKGDEGFQWMIEAIQEPLEKIGFDINQIIQEQMDYLEPVD